MKHLAINHLVVLTFAAALTGHAAAQQATGRKVEGLPGVVEPAPVIPSRRPSPARGESARPCPEYGPGFVRLDGSATCVRASGQVRVEGRWQGSDAQAVSSSSRGRVSLDLRTPTEAGPVRVFVRGEAVSRTR